ncbi:DUF983 domain-containing protein [Rubellimicrobium arenae]|uniref:DUF983 domain-containing protein n=1 Tax=Rubellimicrobium arenae TaxID=2817372 RepID=UPI001B3030F6|nr:DUF983 domain-containing protein [Rubellimicrobium arenae]
MPSASTDRDSGRAMRRGLIGRCPNCGQGRLFAGYLRISPTCPECGEELGRYRAADGPAFFTISIVGLLLVPILGWSFVILRPDPLVLALILTVSITILTLVVLRLVKGAFVGYLWSMHEMDKGA